MPDEIEEDEDDRARPSFYHTLRKIMIAAAALFLVWSYGTSTYHTMRAPKKMAEPPVIETPPPEVEKPQPVVAAPVPPDTGDKERIAAMEAQLLEQGKLLQELKTQLADVQNVKAQVGDIAQQSNHKLALLIAFNALKERVRSGDPFDAELAALIKLLPADDKSSPSLDAIKPYADKGIPTETMLTDQFEAIVPGALDPSASDHSWQQNLKSLIRIRKVGQQPGNDDEAILARAEVKLHHHDVRGALAEMAALSQNATDITTPWVVNAKALIAANDTLSALQLALVTNGND